MLNSLWKEIQEIDTGRRALRSFGWVVGSVLIGLGALVLWKHDGTVTAAVAWLGGIGGVLVATGLVVPSVLLPLHRVWMGLAVIMGFVMTRVILTIVFYLVITPTGIVLRVLNKDPLQRTWDSDASTYWIEKTYDDESAERLERYY